MLWRRGKPEGAKYLAESVQNCGSDWLWARATAHNTLGYLAYDNQAYEEACSFFKKAASLFQTAGYTSRYAGGLNNYANALGAMAEAEVQRGADEEHVVPRWEEARKAYGDAREALEQSGDDPAQRARILLNIGMFWERQKDWQQATENYLHALTIAETLTELTARLH